MYGEFLFDCLDIPGITLLICYINLGTYYLMFSTFPGELGWLQSSIPPDI